MTELYGHQDLIDYLSIYCTRDKAGGRKYFPRGALCWFECNRYGEPLGSVYYIKQVPDTSMYFVTKTGHVFAQNTYRKFMEAKARKKSINEILSGDIKLEKYYLSHKKPILYQPTGRRRIRNAGKENGRTRSS